MRRVIGVFLILGFFIQGAVQARPVLWTFDNVTFDDGALLSGSFIYDAAVNHYSSVNLITEASRLKGFSSPAVYQSVQDASFLADLVVSATEEAPCRDGLCSRSLRINFLYSVPPPPDGSPPSPRAEILPDEGGTVDLQGSVEDSNGKRLYSRKGVSGSVIGLVLPFKNIQIDIKPEDADNFINTEDDWNSEISVAILTTNIADGDETDFDALQVDAESVSFGPFEAEVENIPGAVKDIDSDGDQDLELKFKMGFLGIGCEYSEDIVLVGQTAAGEAVMGADFVTTPDCPGCHP